MQIPEDLVVEIEDVGSKYEINPVESSLASLVKYASAASPTGFEYKQALHFLARLLDAFGNPRGLRDLVPESVDNLKKFEEWDDRLLRLSVELGKLHQEVKKEYRDWKKNEAKNKIRGG